MKTETDFANLKYKLFKNGTPDCKIALEEYVKFKESGVGAGALDAVDAAIYDLAIKDPENDELYISKISPINREKYKTKKEIKNAEEEKIAREKLTSKILITSGYSFEGYKIVKYSGYISGDDATYLKNELYASMFEVTPDKALDRYGESLTDALSKIRQQALRELKSAAYDLGCNAVIGVDYDYVTYDLNVKNLYNGTVTLIAVTANGTACLVEPLN